MDDIMIEFVQGMLEGKPGKLDFNGQSYFVSVTSSGESVYFTNRHFNETYRYKINSEGITRKYILND